MGILSILGLMEETKNTVLSRGHNVKNWQVLGNDCYALECADCKKSVMIKENGKQLRIRKKQIDRKVVSNSEDEIYKYKLIDKLKAFKANN